jgi:predicted GIY-YIG superfamily endonuclease
MLIGTVYLIHFDEPLAHAKHYVGFTTNFDNRMKSHHKGTGARLLAVLNEKSIGWNVSRTWHGVSQKLERAIKDSKNTARFCPVCNKHVRDISMTVERGTK